MTPPGFRLSTIIAPFPFVLAALLIVSLAVSGCTKLRLVIGFQDQAAQARALARIEGQIATEGPLKGNLVVILARVVEGEDRPVGVDSFVRVNPGSYAFVVAPGRFKVGAYEDRNRNGLLDPDERAVRISDSPVLDVGPGEPASFDMLLAVGATLEELTEPLDVLALVERTPAEQRVFSLWAFSTEQQS